MKRPFTILRIAAAIGICLLFDGCCVVSANRAFPELTWYWSADAKEQRREDQAERDLKKQSAPSADEKDQQK